MLDKLREEFFELNWMLNNLKFCSLEEACRVLGGHNLDNQNGYFDLNFKSACYTIFDSSLDEEFYKNFEVGEIIEYYPDNDSLKSQNISKYNLITEQKLNNKQLMIKALEQFAEYSYNLLVAWDSLELGKFPKSMSLYPFQEDFKIMYDAIFEWVQDTVKELKVPTKPRLTEILKQIQAKDEHVYIEVIGVNGLYKDLLGIAFVTENDTVKLWIGDDSGKNDCELSAGQFNEEFLIYNIIWSDKDANAR